VQSPGGLGRLLSLVPRHGLPPAGPNADAAQPGLGLDSGAWPSTRSLALRPALSPARAAVLRPLPSPLVPISPPAAVAASNPAAATTATAPIDLDDLLEALTDRLHVEYLRLYGSAAS
jgi:hypothetical protein